MNSPKYIVYSILSLFLLILALTTMITYTRGYSGTTGLDMAKIQKMRTDTSPFTAERG